MNSLPVDTNQPASEPIPEQMQGCPPAGFWLETDIVTTKSVTGAAGRPAAKSGTTKGGGSKVVSSGGRSTSQNRKRKGSKSRLRKRISIKQA
jgi:hypothetical protein